MTGKSISEKTVTSLGDMDVQTFKKYGHEIVDWIGDYLTNIEKYPVLSQVKPGEIKNNLPSSPPTTGEDMEKILNDFEKIIVPGLTNWQHPSFHAYFSATASMPGILGELLSAGLNQQGMLWKTSPALTELEEVTVRWLSELIGIRKNYFGIIYDTASISTMHAICAAREALNLKIREEGMAGRKDLLPLRLYTSIESHSSVEKAAITLGIGQKGVRKVAVDKALQMDLKALVNSIEEDIKNGCIPFCVVATVGTTSTTSIDPVSAISDICKKYKLWLHVDAAYGGIAAIVPEMKHIIDGWYKADSIVVNPHKWLFTPVDLSVLYTRKPEILKRAFSLVPEYLRTEHGDETVNLMDYGIQLGRRFRALKLWFVMRYFGQEGLISRIREHIRLARLLTRWIDVNPDFHSLPVTFSTVCFRYFPKDLKDKAKQNKQNEKIVSKYLDNLNEEIMNTVNRSGKIYISHTKVEDKIVLRLSIGNIRITEDHIRKAWELLQEHGKRIDADMRNELEL